MTSKEQYQSFEEFCKTFRKKPITNSKYPIVNFYNYYDKGNEGYEKLKELFKARKELERMKKLEEKLKELGYKKIGVTGSSTLFMYYKKEIEHLECALKIFVDYEKKKIRKWGVASLYLISTQGQIDNLQMAFNWLKDDLKELEKEVIE